MRNSHLYKWGYSIPMFMLTYLIIQQFNNVNAPPSFSINKSKSTKSIHEQINLCSTTLMFLKLEIVK